MHRTNFTNQQSIHPGTRHQSVETLSNSEEQQSAKALANKVNQPNAIWAFFTEVLEA